MAQLNFGIRIGAHDDSQGALGSALSGFRSFSRVISKPIIVPIKIARGGLRLLKDINLGLAPIVRGIDSLIERGTGLEVVRKSFESLTGKGGRQAGVMARQLKQAASGTLRLGKAMQIANRALGSGLSFQQLLVAMDFISKKSITTGKNAEQAIEKVITGLSRGSTLFLDDFGILVDGIAGVQRAYNTISGAGAWEALGPAAQKAETIRQAIGEMQQQMGKIGVTGKETVFIFQSIKNAVGDATDKLFAAVGRSGELKRSLEGIRDVIGGITEHVESGGSLADVLLGKKDKKDKRSGGSLLGIAKAGVFEFGAILGKGILGGILEGLPKLQGVFDLAWGKLKSVWETIKSDIRGLWDDLGTKVRGALQPLVDAIAPITKLIPGGAPTTQPATSQPATTQPSTRRRPRRERPEVSFLGNLWSALHQTGERGDNLLWSAVKQTNKRAAAETAARGVGVRVMGRVASGSARISLDVLKSADDHVGKAGMKAGEKIGRGFLKVVAKGAVPIFTIADFLYTSYQGASELTKYLDANRELSQAQAMLEETRRMAADRRRPYTLNYIETPKAPKAVLKDDGFFDSLGKAASGLFSAIASGGGWLEKAMKEWLEAFPPRKKDEPETDQGKYPYGPKKRGELKRAIRDKKQEIIQLDLSDGKLRGEARRKTAEEVRKLRKKGLVVGRNARQSIYAEFLKELEEKREKERDELFVKLRELEDLLDEDDRKREAQRRDRRARRTRKNRARGGARRPTAEDFTEIFEGPERVAARPAGGRDRGEPAGRGPGGGGQDLTKASEAIVHAVARFEAIAEELGGGLSAALAALAGADRRLATVGPKRS